MNQGIQKFQVLEIDGEEWVVVPRSMVDQLQRSLINQVKQLRATLGYSPLMTFKQWSKAQP